MNSHRCVNVIREQLRTYMYFNLQGKGMTGLFWKGNVQYGRVGGEGRERRHLQHGVNSEVLQTSMSSIAGRRAGDIWKSKDCLSSPWIPGRCRHVLCGKAQEHREGRHTSTRHECELHVEKDPRPCWHSTHKHANPRFSRDRQGQTYSSVHFTIYTDNETQVLTHLYIYI